jgi:uncharacterized membrane protein
MEEISYFDCIFFTKVTCPLGLLFNYLFTSKKQVFFIFCSLPLFLSMQIYAGIDVNFGGNLLGIFLILHPGLLDSRISLIFFK